MQLDLVLKFAPFPRCMALHVAVLSLGVRTAQDPGAWRGGGGGLAYVMVCLLACSSSSKPQLQTGYLGSRL